MVDIIFEVCIDSVAGAIAAYEEGAHRLELCGNLAEGGTTPSIGLIEEVCDATPLPVMVMIRPRGGDFFYSDTEFRTMLRNIQALPKDKVAGVVFGCLKADGTFDMPKMQQLIDASQGLEITVHRAFDVCCNPSEALQQLIDLQVTRILTSGQAKTAFEGISLLEELVNQAQGRIHILAGCGVNASNAKQLVDKAGVRELHFTAHRQVDSDMKFRHAVVSMGSNSQEFVKRMPDRNKIKDIIQLFKA